MPQPGGMTHIYKNDCLFELYLSVFFFSSIDDAFDYIAVIYGNYSVVQVEVSLFGCFCPWHSDLVRAVVSGRMWGV